MFPALRASTSRVGARAFSSTPSVAVKVRMGPTPEITQPIDLLTKIGRNADKKLAEKAETWEGLNELWFKGSKSLDEAGLTPRERRYTLWAFERYSQGDKPSKFIKPPAPPKKFRGWGPRVQHGVRVK